MDSIEEAKSSPMSIATEKLAKLKLNNASLSPLSRSTVTHSKENLRTSAVAALASISTHNDNDTLSEISRGVSPKKVGPSLKFHFPTVPPKPNKKQHPNDPEVPQSILVKQTCEPLYSKRLQSNSGIGGGMGLREQPQQQRVPMISPSSTKLSSSPSTTARPPILHRKQPIYATQNNIYSNNSTVTLDNPAILDQQLEALAHHKKQLEKKGLLMQQQQQAGQKQHYHEVPKLSSASFLRDLKGANNLNHKNILYTNVCQGLNEIHGEPLIGETLNVYNNIAGSPQQLQQQQQQYVANNHLQPDGLGAAFVYSNLEYTGSNGLEDLPPPPPAVLSINTADPSEYLTQCNLNDDEIPPPPSPVSSSYSELRRATDIFPKLSLPAQASGMQLHSQTDSMASNDSGSKLHHQHSLALESGNPSSVCSSGIGSNVGQQQTYMNMAYHHNNDYSTYVGSPSSQGFSHISSDYYGYGSFSQGSSTYESIYEPINPRPPSQLSSRSNYMMYAPYVNGPQGDCSNKSNIGVDNCMGGSTTTLSSVSGLSLPRHHHHQQQSANGQMHSHKEAEVEALTDLLVHSMDAGNDSDSYGVCVTCKERVVGENSGCTAMDQVFHIACFTCCQCQINLQGKPFYALEGKPYCEYDYLQTLEKCSVCMKPILERILRATGKPYHPQCFTCVVCGNSLDGIPFTVDAANQNYCIADFHKKFAPRCCVCKLPIMPEAGQEETVRVVALDRSFHFECYKCEDCGLLLSSEAEGRGCYPLDDHVLCKSCNAKRVQTLTNRMTTEL